MKKFFVAGAVLSSALVMAACSPANQSDSTSTSVETTSSSSTQVSDAVITTENAVVRASVEDSDMTAVFATLVNNSDDEINVSGFTANVDAASFEVHEVVDGVMQEKPGGFVIPAGESIELAPGGDHLMIMGLANPIEAGDEVTVTLELADGSEVKLDPIPARTIAAGDEDYGDLGTEGHEGH
ncbi:copper chaperone PCu(A)C [Corynebacterium glutamicum]|uniref:copper chaperone PCu(A)C n=1 Tax=Corynebacterium glutamicum TaxID=1718 RepID=UPI003B5A5074